MAIISQINYKVLPKFPTQQAQQTADRATHCHYQVDFFRELLYTTCGKAPNRHRLGGALAKF